MQSVHFESLSLTVIQIIKVDSWEPYGRGMAIKVLQKKAYHVMFGDMFKITRLRNAWHLINISRVGPNVGIID